MTETEDILIEYVEQGSIPRIYGSASHPDHVASDLVMLKANRQAETELRQETHVFRLRPATTVRGTVVDRRDRPVGGSQVAVGRVGESGRREGVADPQGNFAIPGCRVGENFVTATAAGFTPTTLNTVSGPEAPPVRLILTEGKTLRLRVTDSSGQPVPGANVWYDTFDRQPGGDSQQPSVQAEFNPLTDAEGRVVWEQAPDGELGFDVHKRGYMRVSGFRVRPDDQEHVVVLPPALVIAGTVGDADTDAPIARFQIGVGWPNAASIPGSPVARWSTLERFWPSFEGGTFRHSLEEAAIGGSEPGLPLQDRGRGLRSPREPLGEARRGRSHPEREAAEGGIADPQGVASRRHADGGCRVHLGRTGAAHRASSRRPCLLGGAAFVRRTVLEPAPGETLRLNVGKTDRRVTLGIRLPEGEREPIRFAAITTPFPMPSAEILSDPAKALAWRRQPEVAAAMASSRSFVVERTGDGSWASEAVTPGPYVLQVGLGRAHPTPDHPPRMFQTPIAIPEGRAEQDVDLGEVRLVP